MVEQLYSIYKAQGRGSKKSNKEGKEEGGKERGRRVDNLVGHTCGRGRNEQ